jgi:hypothetical protein
VELGRLETDDPGGCEKHLHGLLEPWRIPGMREWFRLTPDHIANALAIGRAWIANDLPRVADVSTLAATPSDGSVLEPTALARDLYDEIRRLKAEEYAVKCQRMRVENELRVLIGAADEIRGGRTMEDV